MNARARAPAGAVCVVGGAALLPAQDTGTWCLGGVSRCALVPRGGHISAAGGDNKRGRLGTMAKRASRLALQVAAFPLRTQSPFRTLSRSFPAQPPQFFRTAPAAFPHSSRSFSAQLPHSSRTAPAAFPHSPRTTPAQLPDGHSAAVCPPLLTTAPRPLLNSRCHQPPRFAFRGPMHASTVGVAYGVTAPRSRAHVGCVW